jgi:hypothetical protein
MDSQKRLSLLKNMLSRLTGEITESPAMSQVAAAAPPPPSDLNARKLLLLRSMLTKLQGS